jgi:hypothetical protein
VTAAKIIYLLCAMASLLAAWLLFRTYLARRTPLLLWSCIGFVGLVLNNVLVYADLVLFPQFDLSLTRALIGAVGMAALLYGLVWEAGA